jgi:ubiquinone/menaquinone biosynthesis C-methylase UbiE
MEIRNQLRHLKEKAVYAYGSARSLTFTVQSLTLPFWELAATGKSRTFRKGFFKNLQKAQRDLHILLQQDAKNIASGIYPVEVLKPESLRDFSLRYPKIIFDGAKLARRRLRHLTKEFDAEAVEYLRDVPDYFQRNFHFQSGGYLTEHSAELYEHQVEILFGGAADAMRRLLLRPLKEHFPYTKGEGLHFLEVAGGTGRLSRFIKLTFPKARITVLDLSYPYLRKAQDRLAEFRKIDFVQGDASDLQFADQKFDAVVSSFLFHELPLEIRRKVVAEGLRVLKPGGFLGLVDAIQEGDKSDFNLALRQFPLDFHEPFFKNYLQNPMEGLLEHAGAKKIQVQTGFLSKVVWGEKAENSPHFS